MRTSRLEAFSDGVLAIIITIMVLELNVPHEPTLQALGGSGTGFLTYLLSFVYIGIYWNNHHHMFQVVERLEGGLVGDVQLQDHDGDDDGEYAVAERFEPTGSHMPILSGVSPPGVSATWS